MVPIYSFNTYYNDTHKAGMPSILINTIIPNTSNIQIYI